MSKATKQSAQQQQQQPAPAIADDKKHSLRVWATNGKLLARSLGNCVEVFDTSIDSNICTYHLVADFKGHKQPGSVYASALSPDGKLCVVGGTNSLVIYDVVTGTLLFEEPGCFFAVDFNPSRKLIAAGCVSGSILLISRGSHATSKWQIASTEPAAHRNNQSCMSVRFNSDGTKLLSAGNDGFICTWRIKFDETATAVSGIHPLLRISPPAHSPAGASTVCAVWCGTNFRSIAFPTGTHGNQISIANGDNGAVVATTLNTNSSGAGSHHDFVFSLAFCVVHFSVTGDKKSGGLLASASRDCTIRLWHLVGGAAAASTSIVCIASLQSHQDAVRGIAFSSSLPLRLGSVSNDGCAMIWPVAPCVLAIASALKAPTNGQQPNLDVIGEVVKPACHSGQNVTSIAWAPDGKSFVTTSLPGTVRLVDSVFGRKISQVKCEGAGDGDGAVTHIRFLPNGHIEATSAAGEKATAAYAEEAKKAELARKAADEKAALERKAAEEREAKQLAELEDQQRTAAEKAKRERMTAEEKAARELKEAEEREAKRLADLKEEQRKAAERAKLAKAAKDKAEQEEIIKALAAAEAEQKAKMKRMAEEKEAKRIANELRMRQEEEEARQEKQRWLDFVKQQKKQKEEQESTELLLGLGAAAAAAASSSSLVGNKSRNSGAGRGSKISEGVAPAVVAEDDDDVNDWLDANDPVKQAELERKRLEEEERQAAADADACNNLVSPTRSEWFDGEDDGEQQQQDAIVIAELEEAEENEWYYEEGEEGAEYNYEDEEAGEHNDDEEGEERPHSVSSPRARRSRKVFTYRATLDQHGMVLCASTDVVETEEKDE